MSNKISYFNAKPDGNRKNVRLGVKSLDNNRPLAGFKEKISNVTRIYITQSLKLNKVPLLPKTTERIVQNQTECVKKRQRVKLSALNIYGNSSRESELQSMMLVPVNKRQKNFFEFKRASV